MPQYFLLSMKTFNLSCSYILFRGTPCTLNANFFRFPCKGEFNSNYHQRSQRICIFKIYHSSTWYYGFKHKKYLFANIVKNKGAEIASIKNNSVHTALSMLKINKLNLELLKQAKIPVVISQFKIKNFRQDGQAWTFKQRLLLYIHIKYKKTWKCRCHLRSVF